MKNIRRVRTVVANRASTAGWKEQTNGGIDETKKLQIKTEQREER